jgi:CHAT domain-containing protein/Flp pilus assembly protein TadD
MGLKDISRATSFLQQALAIAQELKNPQLEAKVQKLLSLAPRIVEAERLAELGTQQLQTNQFQAALQSFQQALPIYREISRLGEGKALVGLAAAYIGLKDISRATSFLQQALAIAQEVKNPQLEEGIQKVLSLAPQALEVDKLANLGFQQLETSQFEAALQTWQQALTIYRQINSRQGEMNALNNLGVTYRYLGDYTKAIDYCQQSLVSAKGIKDRQGERNALSNLGNAYFFLGDYAKAIDYQQQSLAILREIADKSGERTVLNNLGYSLLKSGKLSEAENMLRTGIKVGETLRESLGSNDTFKVSIFEGQARTYSLLQQALIAQNKTNEALEIAERGRARAFVELWANRFTPSTTQSTIAAPSLPKIQQIAKEQNATLVEYSIINDEFQVGGKVQTKESELYIWVIKPTGEVTFRRADLKPLWQQQSTTLTGLVFDSRESIGARGRGLGAVARVDEESQTNRLQQLHQLLIDPIADLLPTDPNARVVFIPQNTLFLVPFPALVDASGKYLIEKHTLLTAPAIQVLEFTRQRRQFVPGEAKDVLVVGNPTMPRVSSGIGQPPQQLPSLPAAQQEATEIATLFNTQAITGNGATKAVVVQKMSQARVIHLATHGLLDYLKIFLGLPGAGAVALAPSGQDNGLLTTEEILNLKLNAELVVLSACDTGNGKITGDGIIGLSRSLITAGVPSVIVSLWSVPDAPTAFLMTQFYKNLQQNPDKAQALRSAMLITMKQHPNPKDWAAFTLIGEAE